MPDGCADGLVLLMRAFNLRRRDGNAITLLQDLIRGTGLAVHADQVARRVGRTDLPLEELRDGRAFGDFRVVRETAAVVVDTRIFIRSLSVCVGVNQGIVGFAMLSGGGF